MSLQGSFPRGGLSASDVVGVILAAQRLSSMLVYLRDGPAQTIVLPATEAKISTSPRPSILIPGQPVTGSGALQGSHRSTHFQHTGWTRPGKKILDEGRNGTQVCRSGGGRLATRPTQAVMAFVHRHSGLVMRRWPGPRETRPSLSPLFAVESHKGMKQIGVLVASCLGRGLRYSVRTRTGRPCHSIL